MRQNDAEELKLYNNMIEAEFKYLSYLRSKLHPKFQQETKNYVWDTMHYAYKSIRENIEINDDIKSLYKSLCLICHPDKCKKSWSKAMFNLVTEAYQKTTKID